MASASDSAPEAENTTAVIRPGSMLQAGFAGDDAPRAVFPAVVGEPRHPSIMVGFGHRSRFYGDDCFARRGILRMTHPLHDGMPVMWEQWEELLQHTFHDELRVDPSSDGFRALLTTPGWLHGQRRYSERTVELLFETFTVPQVLLASASLLSLAATGYMRGLVLKVGSTAASVVPLTDEANTVRVNRRLGGIGRSPIGGNLVTDALVGNLRERGWDFSTLAEREIVRDIKEKFCGVAPKGESFANDKGEYSKEYELPDGQTIVTDRKCRFASAEPLFDPCSTGLDVPGVSELVDSALEAYQGEPELYHTLLNNIVLVGGTTLLPGFPSRLKADLVALTRDVRVVAAPERKYAEWIGGSILGSLSTADQLFVSRQTYDEEGVAGVLSRMSRALEI